MSTIGTVTQDGSPVAGAQVFLQRIDQPDHTTDAQGQYDVGALPPGTYLVTVLHQNQGWYHEHIVEVDDYFLPSDALELVSSDAVTTSQVNGVPHGRSALSSWRAEDGTLYTVMTWWNAADKATIALRENDEPWTMYTYDGTGGLPDLGTVPGDEHYTIGVGFDPNGYMHVAYRHHNDPLNYRKSVAPIASFDGTLSDVLPMRGQNEDHVAYPTFFNDPQGDLYFGFRRGGSGNGDWYIYKYHVSAETWGAIEGTTTGMVLSRDYYTLNKDNRPSADGINPYPLMVPVWDHLGRMHLFWRWRRTPNPDTNFWPSYIQYRPGEGWCKASGEAVALPATALTADVVEVVPEGMPQRSYGGSVDENGNPHMFYPYRDDSGVSQIRHAWWDGSKWDHEYITDHAAVLSDRISEVLSTRDGHIHIVAMGYGESYDVQRITNSSIGDYSSWAAFDLGSVGGDLVGGGIRYNPVLWHADGVFQAMFAPIPAGTIQLLTRRLEEYTSPGDVPLLGWRPYITSPRIAEYVQAGAFQHNVTTSVSGGVVITAPTLPPGLTLTDNGNGTASVTGTLAPGVHEFEFTVSDGTNEAYLQKATVTAYASRVFEDFAGGTIGSVPSSLTEIDNTLISVGIANDAGASNGRSLEAVADSDVEATYTLNGAYGTDVVTRMRFRFDYHIDDRWALQLGPRYPLATVVRTWGHRTQQEFGNLRAASGWPDAASDDNTIQPYVYPVDTWMIAEVYSVGSSYKVRVYKDGYPSIWTEGTAASVEAGDVVMRFERGRIFVDWIEAMVIS